MAEDLFNLILQHVNSPNYQPVRAKVIAKKLGLPKERAAEVRKAVKRLAKQGKLAFGSRHIVFPASASAKDLVKSDASLVTGVFHRTTRGFGFVRPAGTSPAAGREHDIFIPVSKTGDAATGDTVRIRVKNRTRHGDNRKSGAVVEIVERDTSQFVGVFMERAGEFFVLIDGSVFADPVPVNDPGAKNAMEGDKVVIEMLRFPTHFHPGEGVITEVLGARGTPGVDTMSIVREFGLPDHFPIDVMDTARAQAEAFDESTDDRIDLTAETVITIDPKDARDFDDAISLEQLDNGHWRLGVHIADVAHFVPIGSPLDREARDRATSVYLPGRVIPMIPELISNGLASLQPDKVRYAKTAFIEFTPDGARVACEVCNSAIRSKRRFTYEEVDQFLADPHRWQSKVTTGVFALLGRMHKLAMVLRRRRLEGGAIELTLPEIKIDLDKNGRVAGAHVAENTESHQIIEEFMLAANEAVAEHLNDQGLNVLRRIHEPPDPRKLQALTDFIHDLGIECESLESRFEIKRVVELVRGEPREHAVHYAVLRSMQKAVYSPQEEGHYALNSKHYCHFTSPIRRYPDLVTHRMLNCLFRGDRPDDNFDQLALVGAHCSEREQRAAGAERELVKVKLLTYLSTRIGERMEAVITGVEEFGMFCRGVELPAEGLIRVNTLTDDYYRFDRQTHTLSGHRQGNAYRLGDVLLIEIAHVDINRRELDFRLIQRLPRASGRKRITRTPKKKRTRSKSSAKREAARPKAKKKVAAKKTTKKKKASRREHARKKNVAKKPATKKTPTKKTVTKKTVTNKASTTKKAKKKTTPRKHKTASTKGSRRRNSK